MFVMNKQFILQRVNVRTIDTKRGISADVFPSYTINFDKCIDDDAQELSLHLTRAKLFPNFLSFMNYSIRALNSYTHIIRKSAF